MIISIASGKGGTGKTTVATNLALVLGDRVELLDCDVEEPNAHLFLKPQIDRTEQVDTPIPLVDEAKCTFCRKCAEICRFNAIAVVGRKVLVFPELCHSCGGCVAVCPEGAITEIGRGLGTVNYGHRNGFFSPYTTGGIAKTPCPHAIVALTQTRVQQPFARQQPRLQWHVLHLRA